MNMIFCASVSEEKSWENVEDESVQTVITSPPYWGLRDYGVPGQIGLEKTPEEYVEKIVQVFRFIRKKLRADGTVFLNLGDTYAGSGAGTNDYRTPASISLSKPELYDGPRPQNKVPAGLKPKDLCMIPARVALALQADGWWLRSEIVWYKRNPMPESVRDRPTKAHEMIYLLTKSARYYYDSDAVRGFLDTEAVNDYIGNYETDQTLNFSNAPLASKKQREELGDATEISKQSKGDGGEVGLSQDGCNEEGKSAVGEVSGGAGLAKKVDEDVSQEREEGRGSTTLLHKRQGEISDTPISNDPKRERVSTAGCSQETESNADDRMQFDGNRMGGNQESAERSLRNLSSSQATNEGSHHTYQQGRSTHSAEHSGALPVMQLKEGHKNLQPDGQKPNTFHVTRAKGKKDTDYSSRNLRSVWDIPTQPYPGAHFATFPEKIPELCIRAGTSEKGCCQKCGSPWERIVERAKEPEGLRNRNGGAKMDFHTRQVGSGQKLQNWKNENPDKTLGWQATCTCNAPIVPCLVFDPFAGSGTTLRVAKRMGRRYVGFELNPKYIKDLIEPSLASINPLFEEREK